MFSPLIGSLLAIVVYSCSGVLLFLVNCMNVFTSFGGLLYSLPLFMMLSLLSLYVLF